MELTLIDPGDLTEYKEDNEDTKLSFYNLHSENSKALLKKLFAHIIEQCKSIAIVRSGDEYITTAFYCFDAEESSTMLLMYTYNQEKNDAEIILALKKILEHIQAKYGKINITCIILKRTTINYTHLIKSLGFEYESEDTEGEYGGWEQYTLRYNNSVINNQTEPHN